MGLINLPNLPVALPTQPPLPTLPALPDIPAILTGIIPPDIQSIILQPQAVPAFVTLPVLTVLGGVQVQTTLEEAYEDSLEITEHPVEVGAAITDHAYKKPMVVFLRCGWSNATPSFRIGGGCFFAGGSMTGSDFVKGIYSQLLSLQEQRQPFSISTALRTYNNMLLQNLEIRRDQTTWQALMVTATCREAILVSTQAATLPPQQNQANPFDTAETQNSGTHNLLGPVRSGATVPAQAFPGPVQPPAPGGSLPWQLWTPQ